MPLVRSEGAAPHWFAVAEEAALVIAVDLFNFQDGGRRADGSYDFDRLRRAFAGETPAALIVLCEAKHYGDDGQAGLFAAADVLSDELGVEYCAELGWCERGPYPPAVFYDPQVLKLLRWHGRSRYADKHNLAHFRVHDSDREFLVLARHWSNHSGVRRRQEAGLIDHFGGHELPVLVAGDLNATASGPHLPQRDWTAASYRARSHKARRLPDGTWVSDTDPIDHLIGAWDETHWSRVDGCGFQAIAEMAWRAGVPNALHPTVAEKVDAGGAQLIDWLLVNTAMARFVVAAEYRVHVPDPQLPAPSDHHRVRASLDL
ncbi:hypothetical protein E0H26_25355 [Micromonospora zingiberis]|uniref:Endonuclease/exonuclease/phosphatase domain-containing protein n=1 Tax=Micromonospora zingiberis TaxID=2053011 RepID=A0A4R0G674_9ACTN|nr:hypothetical protein [Micromonospora zingiberis]TCB91617.1 hypothetical protein E0H26_25355 [Micromonospora zingiberis]